MTETSTTSTPEVAPAKPGGSTLAAQPSAGIGVPRAPGSPAPMPGLAPPGPGMPAPGATMFLDGDGLGWIQLNDGSFECIQAPYARQAELHVQVSRASDPGRFATLWSAQQAARGASGDVTATTVPVKVVHIVKEGESPKQIADAYGITKEALLAANQDKVHYMKKGDRQVPFFMPGEQLIIPVGEVPSGDQPAGDEEGWYDWGRRKANEIGEEIGEEIGDIVDGIEKRISDGFEWLKDQWGGGEEEEQPADPGQGGKRLPDERVTYWVDIAAQLNKDKYAQKKSKEPFKVAEIDAWLPELAKDQAATTDAIQRRILAGVQFMFESTKRGTTYNFGSDRDYDIDGTFDCSEAVQWMLQQSGLGDVFGESTAKVATLYMTELVESVFGDQFHAAPRTGDVMMWVGHVGMVMDVRPDEGVFYVSQMAKSGSYFNTYDLNDPAGSAERWASGARLIGFWAPEEASLPAAIGTVTVKASGRTAYKFTTPTMTNGLDSKYSPGEQLELLERSGDAYLVHHANTRGAAWVPKAALIEDPADPSAP